MLTNLNLASFSEENWKSTIRKEVRVHSKYRNLQPWQGHETADIKYKDIEGGFTKLLIEKGYLESDTWEDVQPTYYLEVKTTKKAYDEKFYMSGAQYNRVIPTTKNPRMKSANQRTISDAKHEAAARDSSRRHLRHFARFRP